MNPIQIISSQLKVSQVSYYFLISNLSWSYLQCRPTLTNRGLVNISATAPVTDCNMKRSCSIQGLRITWETKMEGWWGKISTYQRFMSINSTQIVGFVSAINLDVNHNVNQGKNHISKQITFTSDQFIDACLSFARPVFESHGYTPSTIKNFT